MLYDILHMKNHPGNPANICFLFLQATLQFARLSLFHTYLKSHIPMLFGSYVSLFLSACQLK
ncbi:hypothetical protein CW304_11760 [Bacillus sp. UFRGS-B20]|nr:hypothetical protein CW304_11760 [Bacillus sp. UFRGS-B20]